MNEVFNEYKELFIAETEEHIVSLNDSLIFLEKNKGHMKIIDTLFRSAHTIKSSAAALGLIDLSKLAHSAEDVLQKIRCHELSMEDNIIQLLFQVTDIIRDYLAAIKKNQTPHIDIETMIKKLEETLTSEKKHLPLTDPELMFNSEIRREIPWDTLQPLQSNGSESLIRRYGRSILHLMKGNLSNISGRKFSSKKSRLLLK